MSAAQPDRKAIAAMEQLALPGDLVFRTGLSPESLAVRAVSHQGAFSHVGVATRSASGISIIHATPADQLTAGGVIASTWAEFGLADDVQSVHLYRVRQLTAAERQDLLHEAVSMLGHPFDAEFRLHASDGSTYCALLVLQACAHADARIHHHVRPREVAILADPVYLPESLLAWPRLVRVST